MYDPVSYLAAKARQMGEDRRRAHFEARYRAEKAKQDRDDERRHREELARERKERADHPERFVDRWLKLAINCAEQRFGPGLRRTLRELGGLLRSLGHKLGRAMSSDLERLRAQVRERSSDASVAAEILDFIDGVGVELRLEPTEKAAAPDMTGLASRGEP